jgi:hypothetical protein
MKILIAGLKDWKVGGAETWALELFRGLTQYTNAEIDFALLKKKPKRANIFEQIKRNAMWVDGMKVFFWEDPDLVNKLNSYDLIQLVDFGDYAIDQEHWKLHQKSSVPFYFDIFSKVKTKIIGVWHSNPDYLERSPLPYCKEFAKFCCATYTIRKTISTDKGMPYIPHLISLEDMMDINSIKKNLIVSTSRVCSVKATHKLIQSADKIKGELNIYGYSGGFYVLACMKEPNFTCSNIHHFGEFKLVNKKPLYEEAKVLTNFTKLKNDGDGTEYTMLEGWKYMCVPVVDITWCGSYTQNAVVACNRENPIEIAEKINLLLKDDSFRLAKLKSGIDILNNHDSKKVVKQLCEFYKGV